MGMERACLWKYSSLGILIRSVIQIPKCAPRFLHFLMEVGVPRFPCSRLPLRSKTRPKACPPCDSSSHPPFLPNSSPWCGIDSCAVVLPSGTFFTFFFFAVVVFFYLPIAFSHVSFPAPLAFWVLFFCPEKPDFDTKKRWNYRNSNLRKKT